MKAEENKAREVWYFIFKFRNWILKFSQIYSIHNSCDIQKFWLLDVQISSLPQHKKFADLCHLRVSIYDAKLIVYRSSYPEVFCKKGVLRKYTKFTRKHLCQSVLNKVTSLHPVVHSKRNSGIGVFKKTSFIEHLRTTASKYIVTFKEPFSFIHRNLKQKRWLNMLFTVTLSFFVKVVF